MSECQLKRADAFSSKYIGLQPVGRFIPQCEKDGNYSRIQCWGSTGYCWCVDPKTGVEEESTRVRGRPNCTVRAHKKPLGMFFLFRHACQQILCLILPVFASTVAAVQYFLHF